ncbi:MAG: hypothetical protein AAGJ87_00550 [Pseudomonadota bacterium]
MKKLAIAASAAGLFAFSAGAALAGDKNWEAKLEEKFSAMDADGSGGVSEAEYLAAKSEKARANFAKMAGDDGELTLAEVVAAEKAYREKKAKKKKEKSRR